MGIVWEAYHKEVPIFGGPWNHAWFDGCTLLFNFYVSNAGNYWHWLSEQDYVFGGTATWRSLCHTVSRYQSEWVLCFSPMLASLEWLQFCFVFVCLLELVLAVGGGEMAVEEVSVVHACTMCQLVTSMEGQNCAASTLGHRRSGESRMIKNARYWTQAQYVYGIFELGILASRLVRRNEGTLSQSYPELHSRFFRCNRGVIPSRMHWPQSLEFAKDRRDNESKDLHSWMEIRFTRTKQQNHRQAIKVYKCVKMIMHG